MASWYRKITADPTNFDALVDALSHFEAEYEEGLGDLSMNGKRIWEEAKKLPGFMAYRYAQFREIEAIRDFLDLRIRRLVRDNMKTIWDTYNKTFSERMAEKWAENEDDVIALKDLRNEFHLLMEKFAGLTKGMEQLHFQIGNLVRMREAGIEDAVF
jgi:hypothetical protein